MPLTLDPTFLDAPPDPNAPVFTGGFAGGLGGDSRDVTTYSADPGFSADPTANAATASGPDDTGTKMHTMGLPDGGTTADGALLDQFPGAGFSTGTTQPGATAEPGGVAAANGVPGYSPNGGLSGTEGQPNSRPLTPEEQAWSQSHPNGGSFQLIDPTGDVTAANVLSLPGSGTPPPPPSESHFITPLGEQGPSPTAGLPGSPATDMGAPGSFQQEFEKQFGFYDPRFNSQANMEANLLKGDSVIRPQAEYMAQFDPNLRAELNTINGLPDFYNSQNAAQWDAAHNQQLTQRVANNELTLREAQGQGVNVPAHPVDNAHALMTQTLQDTLVKNLADLGATNFKQGFDPYGNTTLDYTAANGTPQQVKASLVDYAQAIDQLRKNIAAPPAAAPPAGGGGGYPPRAAAPRYAPPRGGGGGYAPPAAPQAPAPSVMPTGADVSNDIGSSAGYDTLAAQRLAAFDTMGPGGTRPNVPRSVASAVAYSPGIMPGGYSPYDQP